MGYSDYFLQFLIYKFTVIFAACVWILQNNFVDLFFRKYP